MPICKFGMSLACSALSPFLMLGLSLIKSVAFLPLPSQRYAIVQAAMAATMMATSYGLWQSWVQCIYALGPILFVIAARKQSGD